MLTGQKCDKSDNNPPHTIDRHTVYRSIDGRHAKLNYIILYSGTISRQHHFHNDLCTTYVLDFQPT